MRSRLPWLLVPGVLAVVSLVALAVLVLPRDDEAPDAVVESPRMPPVVPGYGERPVPRIALVPTPVLSTWPPTRRDPFLWPFSTRSPWNHPIGSDAEYGSPDDPVTEGLRADHEGVVFNVQSWTIAVYRAEGPERGIYVRDEGERVASVSVPDGAIPAPPLLPGDCMAEQEGHLTDRFADAHLNLVTDYGTVVELYAALRRCDGNLEVRYEPWQHDLRGSGIGERAGMHAGSRAYGGSSFGGLVRKWELEAGRIRHALAAALPAAQFRSGYVWPATSQDGPHEEAYHGNVPMGTLAALPPDFDLDSIDYSSPYGRVFAEALRDYGVYLVDSAGSGGMTFYGEPEIEELPGWDEISHDLRELVLHLVPILNNGPDHIGGGGRPLAPIAPPLR